MSVFDGYGPTFSQVEYTAERVMSRRVLEPIFEEVVRGKRGAGHEGGLLQVRHEVRWCHRS